MPSLVQSKKAETGKRRILYTGYTVPAIGMGCIDNDTLIEGITDEESLFRPEPGGNCVNWVVGHVIATRDFMFEEFSGPVIMSDAERKKYQRGSDAIVQEDENIRSLTILRERLQNSNKYLWKMLDTIEYESSKLSEEQEKSLAGYSFHEAYHVGQTALLRRLLGKEGVIK